MQIHELNTFSGKPGETDFLAIDTGFDTAKISAERFLETKVNRPIDVNNQYTDGIAGQLLRTKGDGSTEWTDVGNPTDAQTAQAISDWLDAHPEATTTVQDGSLGFEKLITGTLGFVTPEMFGAVGDGTTDDSTAIQSAINFASGNKIPMLLTKTYVLKNILRIKNNLLMLGANAELIFDVSDFDFQSSIFCILTENFDHYDIALSDFNHDILMKGLTFRGTGAGSGTLYNILGISNTINYVFDSCHFILEQGSQFEPFDFRGGNINTVIRNCIFEDLQNNEGTIPGGAGGGLIFRQYNPSIESSIVITNCNFTKKSSDDVIFINATHNISEFVVENCTFNIGKDQTLNKTPANCFAVIVGSGAVVNAIYRNCQIYAHVFKNNLFILTDTDGNSSAKCINCEIATGTSATGRISQHFDVIACNITIENDSSQTAMVEYGIIKNCKIELLANITSYLFGFCDIVEHCSIIGNLKTCSNAFFTVNSVIGNYLDGLLFTVFTTNARKIFNNVVYRYNTTSQYNVIVQFTNTYDCVVKNNYFDFWALININAGSSVWFTGNESNNRFTLSNSGTFKSANNVVDTSFAGDDWSAGKNNNVI